MSDDDEVLPVGNVLSDYMVSQGFIDFETYEQHTSKTNTHGYTKVESSPVFRNNLDYKTREPKYISPCDQSKLMNLLDSKLLLPEDFELMEFLISRTTTFTRHTSYLWFFSGGLLASTITLALYLSKRISFHIPAALSSVLSFLCVRQFYRWFYRMSENKRFSSAVGSLQILCLNVHKLLRLLRETEILSTGQVSTHNIGAALYIPLKNLEGLETLPSWKTLPHVRKFLAHALLDIIDLLKSTCDESRKVLPDWLHIEGYTLTNECHQLNSHTINNLRKTEGYISLKELQLLNDSYLTLQSELLRWIGFCLCPSVWHTLNSSGSKHEYSRIQILKLFHGTHSKLSVISFKLQMHYDIQNIFSEGEQSINHRAMRSDVADLNNMQLELHNLSLLILSMLCRLKCLEDKLDRSLNSDVNTDFRILRESLNQELQDVRSELTSAVQKFETMSVHIFQNKKPSSVQSNELEKEHFNDSISEVQRNQHETNTITPDCHVNSSDEVFLAITDFMPTEIEKQIDDWDVESKPYIPKNLLSELSTTLKPIKENFKEREKAALERAGLVDIDNESGDDNEVTHNDSQKHVSLDSTSKIIKKKKIKSKRATYKTLSSTSEDDSVSDATLVPRKKAVSNPSQNLEIEQVESQSFSKEGPRTGFSVPSDRSIANLIAKKSQAWGLAEEEYYSDD